MKHSTYLTPLNSKNSGFSSVGSNFYVTTESDYNSTSDRAIYFRDIKESWFKMKNRSLSAYLETSFKGLKEGDTVTFEFDLNFISGQPSFKVQLFYLSSSRGEIKNVEYIIDPSNLGPVGQFKRYRVDVLIYDIPSNTESFVLNLRANGTSHDVVVKNIEVTVETSNNSFSMFDNVLSYENNSDYRKVLKIYSQTDILETYKPLKNYELSIIKDNSIDFTGIPAGNFKGLFGLLSVHSKSNAATIYFEYQITTRRSGDDRVSITSQVFNTDRQPIFTNKPESSIPDTVNTTWKKFYSVVTIDGNNLKDYVFDIGNVGIEGIFKIRNVHVSIPRYDDEKKELPNSIENLFSTLELV